jgi:fructose-bisphosphate aldolase class 1
VNALELSATAATLVGGGKGLLAMDESVPTCDKRFAQAGIPRTEQLRHAYREWLVTTPGLGGFISGAILHDETIRQYTADGTPQALTTWPASRARASPRAWTVCVNASPNTAAWAPASPSGAR